MRSCVTQGSDQASSIPDPQCLFREDSNPKRERFLESEVKCQSEYVIFCNRTKIYDIASGISSTVICTIDLKNSFLRYRERLH